jgi:hypothetical protein
MCFFVRGPEGFLRPNNGYVRSRGPTRPLDPSPRDGNEYEYG